MSASLSQFVYDLAIILATAGITMLICKKLNQPLTLGYIIAGFLTGPNFNGFFTVSSMENVNLWSEIGVIFLLFSLGLELSLEQLKSVGRTAIIAELFEIMIFFFLGYGCGTILGWPQMARLFLGSLLVMSSTAVVIKTFDDLGLRAKKFTNVVFGLLIMEDMFGVLVMVLLSTVAKASGSAGGAGLSILHAGITLIIFMVLWVVMGIYLLPTLYSAVKKYMNDELTLVLALALCLGTVVVCNLLGFSSTLGAFLCGSILAATINMKKLPELVKPLQYLFGAIFFVSIGMMVKPANLVTYAGPILLVVLTVYIGKIFGTSAGIFLSGQTLDTALRGGFSLTQLGEFSMIAAGVGVSLGVLQDYVNAVIVAASVITIFTTPLFMRLASPVCAWVLPKLPWACKRWMERHNSQLDSSEDHDTTWMEFIKIYLLKLGLYTIICIGISLLGVYLIEPWCLLTIPKIYSSYVAGIITLIFLAPFLRMLLSSVQGKGTELTAILWFESRRNHLPLVFLLGIKVVTALAFIHFIQRYFFGLPMLIALVVTIMLAIIIGQSRWVLQSYLHIETKFFVNMNFRYREKMQEHVGISSAENTRSFATKLFLQAYKVKEDAPVRGHALGILAWRKNYGCNVLRVEHGSKNYDLPIASTVIRPGDSVLLLGTEGQLAVFEAANKSLKMGLEANKSRQSLQDYFATLKDDDESKPFIPCVIHVNEASKLIGRSLERSTVRKDWHCLAVALERGGYMLTNLDVNMLLQKNDMLWVLGKEDMVAALIKQGLL
jgi:CPA2 family monovalent cation:H+ antiporter-2